MDRWRLILASVYLASMAVLVVKMASPVNIQIIVQGEQEIHVREISNVYTFTDMLVVTAAAIAMASSGLSLVLIDRITPEVKPKSLKPLIKTLSKNERKIYSLIRDMGGVSFQSRLVETSKLSKSTVSIILDRLDAKGLIEKRKRGMSNVIIARNERPSH